MINTNYTEADRRILRRAWDRVIHEYEHPNPDVPVITGLCNRFERSMRERACRFKNYETRQHLEDLLYTEKRRLVEMFKPTGEERLRDSAWLEGPMYWWPKGRTPDGFFTNHYIHTDVSATERLIAATIMRESL